MSFLPDLLAAEIPGDTLHGSQNQRTPANRAQPIKDIFPTSPGFVFEAEETQLSYLRRRKRKSRTFALLSSSSQLEFYWISSRGGGKESNSCMRSSSNSSGLAADRQTL